MFEIETLETITEDAILNYDFLFYLFTFCVT